LTARDAGASENTRVRLRLIVSPSHSAQYLLTFGVCQALGQETLFFWRSGEPLVDVEKAGNGRRREVVGCTYEPGWAQIQTDARYLIPRSTKPT